MIPWYYYCCLLPSAPALFAGLLPNFLFSLHYFIIDRLTGSSTTISLWCLCGLSQHTRVKLRARECADTTDALLSQRSSGVGSSAFGVTGRLLPARAKPTMLLGTSRNVETQRTKINNQARRHTNRRLCVQHDRLYACTNPCIHCCSPHKRVCGGCNVFPGSAALATVQRRGRLHRTAVVVHPVKKWKSVLFLCSPRPSGSLGSR